MEEHKTQKNSYDLRTPNSFEVELTDVDSLNRARSILVAELEAYSAALGQRHKFLNAFFRGVMSMS